MVHQRCLKAASAGRRGMGIVLVHVLVADNRHMSIAANPASQTDHIEYNFLTMAGYYVSPTKIRPVVRRVRFVRN